MLNIDKYKVSEDNLKFKCSLDDLDFKTTEDIEPLGGIIGQDRAVTSIEFGLKMKHKGYNIYIAGVSGIGRTNYAKSLIKKNIKFNENLKDWIYVNNFRNNNEPVALSFKAGVGKEFKNDIDDIIEKLKVEIPKIFNSKEYENHNRLLMTELENNIHSIIDELNEFAKPKGFKFQITERGLLSVPIKEDGKLMEESELGNLTPSEIRELRERGLKLNQESKEYIDKIKSCEDIYKNKSNELDRNVGRSLVGFYGQYLLTKYGEGEKVNKYINALCNDIVNNIAKFKKEPEDDKKDAMALLGIMPNKRDDKFLNRYRVNLFIDNSECKECKIIVESNPTYYNLTGSIEYKNEMGSLTTSFMEIKPGAIHKANGGFLIINVRDLLSNPFSWECLKRTLKTEKINIESLNKQYGYLVTSTLKPEPIDLDLKVILIGDSYYYNLLYAYEDDFRNLFKIMADFDIEVDRNKDNIYKTVQLISNKCKESNLKHFDKSAVERLIEYSTRISDDKDKLSARFNKIVDIIYEADAVTDDYELYVTRKDVDKAIKQKIYRNNKYEEN